MSEVTPAMEIDIPTDEEISDAIAGLDEETQAAVRRCCDELNDMVEEFGADVLMLASMVVSASLARTEPPLNS